MTTAAQPTAPAPATTAPRGRRAWSDLTVTDVFCGAGGNTIGAKRAGLRVRVGLNHWERAIETYATNNRDVDVVERVDVSLCDPRRYPSTDIGIFSPECTTHSPAGGNRHRREPDLFNPQPLDAATVRSRVTMFDVVRFAEYHQYKLLVVENVVEATRWALFPDWLRMLGHLGYQHRMLCLNSMFFHPTPQSRDRLYVVCWRKGNPAPDLDYRPTAPCARCGDVAAVQAWRPERTIGKYRRQYVYRCPRCAGEVTPYYYAALNALDLTLPAERVGDRQKPLRPRTLERIRFGLEKYGRRALVINTRQMTGLAHRARPADDEAMPTQTCDVSEALAYPAPFLVRSANGHQNGAGAVGAEAPMPTATTVDTDAVVTAAPFLINSQGGVHARPAAEPLPTQVAGTTHDWLVQPGFLVETAQSHSERRRPRGLAEPMPTMGTQPSSALVLPFVVSAGSRPTTAAGDDAMPTQTASERLGVVTPFVVTLRTNASADAATDPLRTACADGNHHVLVQGAAQLTMRDAGRMHVGDLAEPLRTQLATCSQSAILSRAPFLVSYYGQEQASPADAAVPAVTTLDRHGVVGPELRAEDCYFRMLQPHEIGAAMAFPAGYVVGGTKRDRVKQYGNAVTPPVMDWIIEQCARTLAPEVEGRLTNTAA